MSVSFYQKYFDVLANGYRSAVGVYDEADLIVAATDPNLVGLYLNNLRFEHKTYAFSETRDHSLRLFVQGNAQETALIAPVITAALKSVDFLGQEFDDQEYFVRQLISGNVDHAAWKARSLGIEDEEYRVAFVIRAANKHMALIEEVIREVLPVKGKDFLFEQETGELVFIKYCKTEPIQSNLMAIAQQISSAVSSEILEQVAIGVGSISESLETLPRSYKAAVNALEIGEIFENKDRIYAYMNLGISRLIASIPIEKCKTFLREVLKSDDLREIDNDVLVTVQRFFDYDLNISLAARELYIHRNTLVYRLDRVQKHTGLDVRKFDDAVLFKIAMLIQRYLSATRR